jgi:hypothetical protein
MSTKKRPKRTRTPADDPVVAEVRRIRARMLKKAGGTLEGLQRYVAAQSAKRAESAAASGAKPVRASRRRRAA